MARSIDLDMECWFCDAPLEREDVERDGLMVPRRRSEGGPYFLFPCPRCTRKSRVERNRVGAFLATPPPIVPVIDPLMATFDADLKAELERKREHAQRRPARRDWFFGPYADELWAEGVRPVRRAVPPPLGPARSRAKTARPKPSKAKRPPPPVEPPPRAAPPAPPRPEPEPDAHEVLGIEEGADREAIQSAFRGLAKRYHPDKFEALDEEFRELAQAKFLRLKAAYDELLERLPDADASNQ